MEQEEDEHHEPAFILGLDNWTYHNVYNIECITIQLNTVSLVQYMTLQYSTVQYSTI